MDARQKVVVGLAGIIEEVDELFGVDSAPHSAEVSTDLGFPDLAYESLVHVGVPAPDALDMVLEACDRLEMSRELAFTLILWSMEPWTLLME